VDKSKLNSIAIITLNLEALHRRIGTGMVKCPFCKQKISPQNIETERFSDDDEEYVTLSCPAFDVLLGIQKS
jgi:hypothetical protein